MSTRFIWLAVAGLLGIVTALIHPILGSALLLFLLLFLFFYRHDRLFFLVLVASSFLAYFFVGIIDGHQGQTNFTGTEQNFFVKIDRKLSLDGQQVRGEVTEWRTNERFILKKKFKSAQEKKVFTDEFSYPALCKVTGKLEKPASASNPNAFDYRRYLSLRKVHWILTADSAKLSDCKSLKHTPLTYISERREKGIAYIEEHFPQTTSPLVVALVFGERSLIDERTLENYQKLGIIHLLAISGLHVGLVSGIAYYLGIRMGLTRETTIKWLLLLLPLYALFTGAAPSVIRAVTMICFVLGSQLIERIKLKPMDSVAIAFLLFVLFLPTAIFQAGFQLSFVVSFALIVSAPYIFSRHTSRITQLFLISLTAQMASFPILLYHFYEFSLLSVVMNLFYVPLFSLLVLPLALFTFIGHLMSPLLTAPLISLLNKIINVMNTWTEKFADLPFATLTLGKPTPALLVAYFLALGLFFYHLEGAKKVSHLARAFLFPCAIIVVQLFTYTYSPTGEITFIDVGQGDSIFIRLPHNKGNYLIDTGGVVSFEVDSWQERTSSFEPGRDIVHPFLKSKGIKRIDKMIISHSHMDHMGGAFHLLAAVETKELVLPFVEQLNEGEEALLRQAEKFAVPVRFVQAGMTWQAGETKFYVVSPSVDSLDRNNGSIVLYSKIGQLTWLFTGDLEEAGERMLMRAYPSLRADVLKVGHHGSKTSSTEPFLAQLAPHYAIISAGRANRFGHPHKDVLTSLVDQQMTIYRTDEDGAITYIFKKDKQGFFSKMIR